MRAVVAFVLCLLSVGSASALADAPPAAALHAFDTYVDAATAGFVARALRPVADGDAAAAAALTAGEIVAGPGSGDGILDVEGGLIHHWRARVRLPAVSLDRVQAASTAYD